jgi:hypothetical protein
MREKGVQSEKCIKKAKKIWAEGGVTWNFNKESTLKFSLLKLFLWDSIYFYENLVKFSLSNNVYTSFNWIIFFSQNRATSC